MQTKTTIEPARSPIGTTRPRRRSDPGSPLLAKVLGVIQAAKRETSSRPKER